MKIKKARIASPDDPIYKEGWQTFSMRTKKRTPEERKTLPVKEKLNKSEK